MPFVSKFLKVRVMGLNILEKKKVNVVSNSKIYFKWQNSEMLFRVTHIRGKPTDNLVTNMQLESFLIHSS